MTRDPHTTSTTLFTQVQISPAGHTTHAPELSERAERHEQTRLLQNILSSKPYRNLSYQPTVLSASAVYKCSTNPTATPSAGN